MDGGIEIRKGWHRPCHIRGGMLVHFERGRAVKVQGDPENPMNRGALCPRGHRNEYREQQESRSGIL